jgi:hypothetical protein
LGKHTGKHWKISENILENLAYTLKCAWKNPSKLWENIEKKLGKSWKAPGKISRKPWKKHWEIK